MEDLNDKITLGNLAAAEWNQVPSEIQNVIEGTGQGLTNADLNQLGKGITNYVGNGSFYEDSGSANSYQLGAIGSNQLITTYTDGLTVEFLPANTNTSASTVQVGLLLGAVNIANTGLGGEIVADEYIRLKYRDGTSDFIIDPSSNVDIRITGENILAPHENLVCESNTATTANIDANAVLLKTETGKKLRAESVDLTVDIEGPLGENGLDTGSEASDTWYNLWVISDGATVSGLLSVSSTSPTLPAGFIFKGLVGAVLNNSSGNFILFHQIGESVSSVTSSPLVDASATILASVILSGSIPPIAVSFSGYLEVRETGGGNSRLIMSAGSVLIAETQLRNGALGTERAVVPFSKFPVITSQMTFYRVNQASEEGSIHVSGWGY